MDLVKSDPAITQESPEPIVFRCKRCRRVLAAKSSLLTHSTLNNDAIATDQTVENHVLSQIDQIREQLQCTPLDDHSHSEKTPGAENIVCTRAYFFEPIAWMHDILHHTQGRLICPKCKSKLGNFNWVMASRCPCGKQIQPAFYMMPSRIEKSNVVQNVQVTV